MRRIIIVLTTDISLGAIEHIHLPTEFTALYNALQLQHTLLIPVTKMYIFILDLSSKVCNHRCR